MQAVQFLNFCHAGVLQPHVFKVAESLALICESEDFATCRTDYICNAEDAAHLLEMKTGCLEPIQKGLIFCNPSIYL